GYTFTGTDDVYIDPDSNSVTITGATQTGDGGKFEAIDIDDTPAVVQITDDAEPTTASLTGGPASISEDGNHTVTSTVTLDNPVRDGDAPVTVTLSNGQTVTITSGNSGTVDYTFTGTDDVYIDPTSSSVTITDATQTGDGGKFEAIDIDDTAAVVQITDDIDPVTATLTTSTAMIGESGGTITYTVTLTGGPGSVDPDTSLTFTLADGTVITIEPGQTTGSAVHTYTDAQITNQQTITNHIVSHTGGSEYEKIETTGETSVNVNYAPSAQATVARVSEEGLGGASPDSIGATDTTNAAYVTGSISAADPNGDPLTFTFTFASAPTGLSSNGVAITWTGLGTATVVGSAGGTPILTATVDASGQYAVSLAGPLDHPAQGEDQLNAVFGVNVSDGMATVSTTFTVTVEDDSPVLGEFDPATLPNETGTVSGEFELAQGADGIDHFNITGPALDNIDYTTATLADGTTILHGMSTIDDSEVFNLTVRPDGTYSYAMVNPGAEVPSQTYSMANLHAGNNDWAETADGRIEFSSPKGINLNNTGLGVGNSYIGKSDWLYMEFHQPSTAMVDDTAATNPDFASSVTFEVGKINGSGGMFGWVAVNTVSGATESGFLTIGGTGVFRIDPSIDFNRLSFYNANLTDGQGIQISLLSFSQSIVPGNLEQLFTIQAVDNDGDVSAAQSLAIQTVDSTHSGQGSLASTVFTLTGNDGQDDWLAAGTETDRIDGLDGTDVVDYSDSTRAILVDLDESGHAKGAPANGTAATEGHIAGGDAGGDTLDHIEGIVGGQGDDTLIGNSHDNYFDGGAGSDTVDAGAGNDIVVYDDIDTILAGNAGNDTLMVNETAAIDLSATSDQTSGDQVIVTGFENVDASGSHSPVALTGDGNDNTLVGGSGDDTFDGGAGGDTLTGGAGSDTFMASGGDDRITDYNRGEGDVVDISNLLSDATRDNLTVSSDDGAAKLVIHDNGGTELGSVTFETIDNSDNSMSLDSLLNQVEVKDSHGTL
ncbi:MAG: immunoglobulin-like domain-containing protein, partial [Desulfopila sp.]